MTVRGLSMSILVLSAVACSPAPRYGEVPDTTPAPDAAVVRDGGADAGFSDAGKSTSDAGSIGGGTADAGTPDGGVPDAGWARHWQTPTLLTALNSSADDSQPAPSADGLMLCFASTRSGGKGGGDIWCSKRPNTTAAWGSPYNESILNSSADDWTPWLRADGREILFSTNRSGNPDLYHAMRDDPAMPWGTPQPITELNIDSEYDPVLSPDGLTLFFASTRSGGAGGSDYYRAHRSTSDAQFGRAYNVAEINTSGNEYAAGVTLDGKTFLTCREQGGVYTLSSADLKPDDTWGSESPLRIDGMTVKQPCVPRIGVDGTLYFEGVAASGSGRDLYSAAPVR